MVGNNSGALGDVDTVQELSDILVLDARLVGNGSGRLRDVFNVVALDDQFVLLVRQRDLDALAHGAVADEFLAQKVAQLDRGAVVVGDGVDGEMRIDETHFVEEALGCQFGSAANESPIIPNGDETQFPARQISIPLLFAIIPPTPVYSRSLPYSLPP